MIIIPNEDFPKYTTCLKETTMIYTHCVPVRTVKESKSPLDF